MDRDEATNLWRILMEKILGYVKGWEGNSKTEENVSL
jgi:hypothetical protein